MENEKNNDIYGGHKRLEGVSMVFPGCFMGVPK